MFPNRLAWPPDLPITRFWEPIGPFGDVLLWSTTVPGAATFRLSAFVRRTVFLTALLNVGDCGPAGKGVGLGPTTSWSPGFVPARTPTFGFCVSSIPASRVR